MIKLRTATPEDTRHIISLNADVVAVTSPMNVDRFQELLNYSAHCIVADKDGELVGFVLAMEKGAAYENGNYSWFADRLNNFVYVDRIVISKKGQGHGLGGKLYAHVAEAAEAHGCTIMCAEMDLLPPNEQSLKFHERDGFVELGTRILDSDKTVSMQVKNL